MYQEELNTHNLSFRKDKGCHSITDVFQYQTIHVLKQRYLKHVQNVLVNFKTNSLLYS